MKFDKRFAASLENLRTGEIDFATFAKANDSLYQSWAAYFLKRYPQRYLVIEDLTQEMLLKTWQAVDVWREDGGAPLLRFVRSQVGGYVCNEMQRVRGWPSRGRHRLPVVIVSNNFYGTSDGEAKPIQITDTGFSPEEDAIIREFIGRMPSGFYLEVLRGIYFAGLNYVEAAKQIYNNPKLRLRFRLDSEGIAINKARRFLSKAS